MSAGRENPLNSLHRAEPLQREASLFGSSYQIDAGSTLKRNADALTSAYSGPLAVSNLRWRHVSANLFIEVRFLPKDLLMSGGISARSPRDVGRGGEVET